MAGPSSRAASITTSVRSERPLSRSSFLWAFSTNTTAASTMSPIAMMMPARDMMLALRPIKYIGIKARATAMGRVMAATSAERTWKRKRTIINTTVTMTRVRLLVSVRMEPRISGVRS